MNILFIYKDRLKDNIDIVKKISGDAKICFPVKANAYGHGIEPIVSATSDWVDYYATANVLEAIRVSKVAKNPVLVFGAIDYEFIEAIFKNDFRVSIQCYDDIAKLENFCQKYSKKIKVHIMVNTGMNRMGVDYKDAERVIKKSFDSKLINLEGVYSHLACADVKDNTANETQKYKFERISSYAKSLDVSIISHLANSYGLVGQKSISYDMVRTGILIYGYLPNFRVNKIAQDIKPVAKLVSKIVKLIRLEDGDGVGYSLTYRGSKGEQIAIIPLGYGDGYPRELGNIASVGIDGKTYQIVGRISMDSLAVSLGCNKYGVKVGGNVDVISDIPRSENSVRSLASKLKTIEYDIITTLNQRILRTIV